jgi:hypothetical protein
MQKRTRVVVYGSSLNMAGVAASLKADTSMEVVCVDPRSAAARQRLNELNPSAITFDLSDPQSSLDVKLLSEQPGLLLIGVDPSSDDVLVLSGQIATVLSGRQLAGLVSEHVARALPVDANDGKISNE